MPHTRATTGPDTHNTGVKRTSITIPEALHEDARDIMAADRCTSFSELVAFLIRLRKIERERQHLTAA